MQIPFPLKTLHTPPFPYSFGGHHLPHKWLDTGACVRQFSKSEHKVQ